MGDSEMREYWDRRAAEDPFYFVDNRQRYGHPDAQLFWSRGEQELDQLLSAMGAVVEPGDDVVEIGCGIGRLTRALAARARTVRAVDVSPGMLEHARRLGRELDNVQWVLGDGTSLRGIDDGSADACLSHVVFQHIPHPEITLGYVREIGRVLRPGGWSMFQISNDDRVHRSPRGRERLAVAARATLRRGPRGQTHPAWLGSAVSLQEVREAASAGGMQVLRIAGEATQMCCVLTRRLG